MGKTISRGLRTERKPEGRRWAEERRGWREGMDRRQAEGEGREEGRERERRGREVRRWEKRREGKIRNYRKGDVWIIHN